MNMLSILAFGLVFVVLITGSIWAFEFLRNRKCMKCGNRTMRQMSSESLKNGDVLKVFKCTCAGCTMRIRYVDGEPQLPQKARDRLNELSIKL